MCECPQLKEAGTVIEGEDETGTGVGEGVQSSLKYGDVFGRFDNWS